MLNLIATSQFQININKDLLDLVEEVLIKVVEGEIYTLKYILLYAQVFLSTILQINSTNHLKILVEMELMHQQSHYQ